MDETGENSMENGEFHNKRKWTPVEIKTAELEFLISFLKLCNDACEFRYTRNSYDLFQKMFQSTELKLFLIMNANNCIKLRIELLRNLNYFHISVMSYLLDGRDSINQPKGKPQYYEEDYTFRGGHKIIETNHNL